MIIKLGYTKSLLLILRDKFWFGDIMIVEKSVTLCKLRAGIGEVAREQQHIPRLHLHSESHKHH